MEQLVWNPELAWVAQRWSDRCVFEHDSFADRKICSRDYEVGQNLYYKWEGRKISNWKLAVESWYNEVYFFNKDSTSSFMPNDSAVISHYTQVVWASTKEVGCGATYYVPFMNGISRLYVCNYGPRGNQVYGALYRQGAPGSLCSGAVTQDGLCV
ncbi:CRISP/Allergen/PR-1-like [Scylla paramamosain]|uniref:CRISP/Allergen/PR-1-like n=1 Tax=Scylla paramamosain TaxID=85552 RepID=UPI0030838994